AYNQVSDRYSRKVTVPGFRPGHAPVSLVRKKYKDEIREEVLGRIIPLAVSEAIESNKLEVIGEPEVELEKSLGTANFGNDVVSFRARMEVFPTIELQSYKGLSLTRYVSHVKEEDIDHEIEQLRELSASLTPVEDRGAQLEDILTIDFHGVFVDDQERPNIDVEDAEVFLASEHTLPEVRDGLLGAQVDEEREFTVHYPEDYVTSDLADKTVAYKAKIKTIKFKELPTVDDEWARSVNEDAQTLEDLRKFIEEQIAQIIKDNSDLRIREEAIDKLIALHEIEVPPTLLSIELRGLWQSTAKRMVHQGIDLRDPDIDLEAENTSLKYIAERRIRSSLLLNQIAKQEAMHISNEDIDTELLRIAEITKKPVDEVRDVLTKENGKSRITSDLMIRRTLDLLIEHADITEEEWRVKDEQDSHEQVESEQVSNVEL
ncbi:MAG: trigger factor, partial [Pyrinomonadaceae bacterium]